MTPHGRTVACLTGGQLPDVGSAVDLLVPIWTNSIGAVELGTVWENPDFDPDHPAFYCAEAIDIPTLRWTAYDAVAFVLDLPPEIALVTQEAADTSPISNTPGG